MNTAELCFALSMANGTSGDESSFVAETGALLARYADFSENTLHSLVATIGNGAFEILLDAHIDRVGLLVREIDDNGFLLVDKVGGIDPRVLVGSEVIVCARERLTGVICSTPPHLQKGGGENEVSLQSLAVDIGLDKAAAQQKVQIGDRVLFYPYQTKLLGTHIASPALDDRAGVAALLLAVEKVKEKLRHCRVRLQLSSQEESGGSGAKTSAFEALPDVAIAVDVGFGVDPYCEKSSEMIDLGGGPSIGISPVLDRTLTNELVALAKENGIPYQHDVMPGRTGTNADHIQISRGGVKTALLSIPLRSMHTGVEVIDTCDVENTAALLAAFILKKEAQLSC